jgi:hypothetical protein
MFDYFSDLQKLLVIIVSQHLTSNIFVERLKLITQVGWSHDCEFNPFKSGHEFHPCCEISLFGEFHSFIVMTFLVRECYGSPKISIKFVKIC